MVGRLSISVGVAPGVRGYRPSAFPLLRMGMQLMVLIALLLMVLMVLAAALWGWVGITRDLGLSDSAPGDLDSADPSGSRFGGGGLSLTRDDQFGAGHPG